MTPLVGAADDSPPAADEHPADGPAVAKETADAENGTALLFTNIKGTLPNDCTPQPIHRPVNATSRSRRCSY